MISSSCFFFFRTKAQRVSDVIADITDALMEAAGVQGAAQDAIAVSENDMKMAEDILKRVGNLFFFHSSIFHSFIH